MGVINHPFGASLLDVYPFFETLSQLNHETSLLTLFEQESLPQKKEEKVSFIWSYLSKPQDPEKEYRGRLDKFLRRSIKNWTEKLEEKLEEVRYRPLQLKKLQDATRDIFSQRKMIYLKRDLEQMKVYSEKTQKALNRFESLIERTLYAPLIGDDGRSVKRYQSAFLLPPLRNYLLAPYNPLFLTKSKDPIEDNFDLRKVKSDSELLKNSEEASAPNRSSIEHKKLSLRNQKRAMEISSCDHSQGKGWEDLLLKQVKEVSNTDIICEVGIHIEGRQMFPLINGLLNDQDHNWKLVFLLGSLKYSCFVETIHSLSPDVLQSLNTLLKNSPEENRQWFKKQFSRIRQAYIDDCNAMVKRIDGLAKRFREDEKGLEISFSDLKIIQEFEDYICLRKKGINEHLKPLIKDVILHPETNHVLFSGLIREYDVLLIRLKDTREHEGRPPGCLFPIIYRNVFEQERKSDDEYSIEILGAWSVLQDHNYREVGLFGDISDEQFNELNRKNRVFIVAQKNLNQLGIEFIEHWKKKKIFNQTMLKEYLHEKQRRKNLTHWTRMEL